MHFYHQYCCNSLLLLLLYCCCHQFHHTLHSTSTRSYASFIRHHNFNRLRRHQVRWRHWWLPCELHSTNLSCSCHFFARRAQHEHWRQSAVPCHVACAGSRFLSASKQRRRIRLRGRDFEHTNGAQCSFLRFVVSHVVRSNTHGIYSPFGFIPTQSRPHH
jgi:hypothetical protein